MPKVIELTIEIEVQKVSCPGVWLCQDGRVSLTVFALGTSYQTCLLPPVFPLAFRDVFYFRKRFQESCALNNICCLLKDETIYCELVQWCGGCGASDCVILAQYLGAMNDVLFPPNMCSTDGVDLLMRRSKEFPGILSPKIEIATKVRIDEVWNPHSYMFKTTKVKACHCSSHDAEGCRQKQVCHSAQYHRSKCTKPRRSRSRSRSRSDGSMSCCSLDKDLATKVSCGCPNLDGLEDFDDDSESGWFVESNDEEIKETKNCRLKFFLIDFRSSPPFMDDTCYLPLGIDVTIDTRISRKISDTELILPNEDRLHKLLLESRYIDQETNTNVSPRKNYITKLTPCVCEICKRYHELFHTNDS